MTRKGRIDMQQGIGSVPEKPVEYYPRKGKMLQIALFGLLFVIAGFYLMIIGFGPGEDHSIFGGIMGGLSLLLGLAGLVLGVKQSLSRQPGLILDENGLYDHTSASGAGFVAWSAISRIEPYALMNQPFIGVDLYDPAEWLERRGAVSRGLMKANRGLVSYPVNLAMQGFGREAADILIEMEAYWQRYGDPGAARSSMEDPDRRY